MKLIMILSLSLMMARISSASDSEFVCHTAQKCVLMCRSSACPSSCDSLTAKSTGEKLDTFEHYKDFFALECEVHGGSNCFAGISGDRHSRERRTNSPEMALLPGVKMCQMSAAQYRAMPKTGDDDKIVTSQSQNRSLVEQNEESPNVFWPGLSSLGVSVFSKTIDCESIKGSWNLWGTYEGEIKPLPSESSLTRYILSISGQCGASGAKLESIIRFEETILSHRFGVKTDTFKGGIQFYQDSAYLSDMDHETFFFLPHKGFSLSPIAHFLFSCRETVSGNNLVCHPTLLINKQNGSSGSEAIYDPNNIIQSYLVLEKAEKNE